MPNFIGTAVATDGSVSNVAGKAGGRCSRALCSRVAYWAFNGSGIYDGKPKVDVLRAIANLYPESFHVVERNDSGIKAIRDLKGKRVRRRASGISAEAFAQSHENAHLSRRPRSQPIWRAAGPQRW